MNSYSVTEDNKNEIYDLALKYSEEEILKMNLEVIENDRGNDFPEYATIKKLFADIVTEFKCTMLGWEVKLMAKKIVKDYALHLYTANLLPKYPHAYIVDENKNIISKGNK